MSILRALRGLITRGVVKKTDATQQVQTLDIDLLADDDDEAVEHFQGYGFSAAIPSGSEVIVVCVGGASDHQVVIASDSRKYRPIDLADEEVCLYSKFGPQVRLTKDSEIILGVSSAAEVAAAMDVAIASKVEAQMTTLKTAISGAAVAAMDGGATFKANLIAALAAWPGDTASANVKAKV